MKVIRNTWFPFGSFAAINLFGVVFSKYPLTEVSRNHEFIHTLQQREMLFVFFYLVYGLEWLVRILQTRDVLKAYHRISFEREAYANQHNLRYKNQRRFWAWTKYFN